MTVRMAPAVAIVAVGAENTCPERTSWTLLPLVRGRFSCRRYGCRRHEGVDHTANSHPRNGEVYSDRSTNYSEAPDAVAS